MGLYATTAIIAGTDLSNCRVELVDAEKFLSNYVGSTTWSNSGDAQAQIVNVGVKGNLFGVRVLSMEESDLTDIIDDVETATAALNTFQVNIVVGTVYDIDVYCNKSIGQVEWLKHGLIRNGWVDTVEFRFISRAIVP